MSHDLADSLATGGTLILIAVVLSTDPSPKLAFVLQVMGIGTLLGMIHALLKGRPDPEFEPWRFTMGWAVALAVPALALVIGEAVL